MGLGGGGVLPVYEQGFRVGAMVWGGVCEVCSVGGAAGCGLCEVRGEGYGSTGSCVSV